MNTKASYSIPRLTPGLLTRLLSLRFPLTRTLSLTPLARLPLMISLPSDLRYQTILLPCRSESTDGDKLQLPRPWKLLKPVTPTSLT